MGEPIRFAIFTDTHLGNRERDAVRGSDSFDAFEECLSISEERNVDAILHAGDMFDDSAPSRSTYIKTLDILKRYILGQNESSVEISQWDGLGEGKLPNTLNDKLNVKLPIFMIHGNHDPPAGFDLTSACELFTSVDYVNYFSKVIDTDLIELKPVVFRKGAIGVCVYGLGFINETKFIQALERKTIRFERPDMSDCSREFNILLLHQNRPVRNSQQLAVPHMLSTICPWIDLVVWGHEHECRIDIENSCGIKITQPGSTIVTSYGKETDVTPRSMAILEIYEDSEYLDVTRLRKPRQFIYETMHIGEELLASSPDAIIGIMRMKLEEMIASMDIHPDGEEKLPLIHLRVIATDLDMSLVNHKQLIHEFDKRVANPESLIEVSRRTRYNRDKSKSEGGETTESPNEGAKIDLEAILEQKFERQPLSFLVCDTLNDALTAFVQGDEKDAFKRNIEKLYDLRVQYAVGKAPVENGMTLDEAEEFIDSIKNDLPFLQLGGSVLVRRSQPVQSDETDTSEQTSQKSQSSRKKKVRVDEPEPEPIPVRPKRKKTGSLASYV